MIETDFLVQQYNFKRTDDHLLKMTWIFVLAFVSDNFRIYRYSKYSFNGGLCKALIISFAWMHTE